MNTTSARRAARRRVAGLAATAALALQLTLLAIPLGVAVASHSPSHFLVTHSGSAYVAASTTKTYSGALKTVVESAVTDLNAMGGGTVTFEAGVFNLGSTYFRFVDISDIVFEGQGIDATVIQNYSTAAADTEPFNTNGTYNVVIRDVTVSAGGSPRGTSDALDMDQGNFDLIERVKITASRGKGIIFDGKDGNWTSTGNIVRDCEISGTNNDGIQFLASTNNRVEGCFIHDVVADGIEATKSQSNATQPNKKSNDNTIINNVIDNAGDNGIRINSSDRNIITGNQITNSSDDRSGYDGIRLLSMDSIRCDDNRVESNSATDNQATKTQAYGLNIASSLCRRTFVAGNSFTGNKTGEIRDLGTGTIYGNQDLQAPTKPSGLVATAVNSGRIDLSWIASTDNVSVTAYTIYRAGSVLATVDGSATTYQDLTVLPSTDYAYTVNARDIAGNQSPASDVASATTPAPDAAPSGLMATAGDGQVTLNWTAAPGATGYTVNRSTTTGGRYGDIGSPTPPTATTYVDGSLANGTTYYYVVTATHDGAQSGPSNEAMATPSAPNRTYVFSDGFESGDLSKWTTTSGLIVQTSLTHSGTQAAQGTTTDGRTYAKKLLSTTQISGYLRSYVYLAAGYTSQVNVLRYRTTSDTSLGYLFVTTAGSLGLRNDVGGTTTTSTTPFTSAAWHSVELRLVVNGTSSSTEVWLDGTRVNDLSLSNQNWGTTPIGKVQIGEVQSGRAYSVVFDDVAFDTQLIGP